jgi:Phage tail sheath C-terminal domain
MALVSPGVQVTVIDESQYIPSATNSVPYFLIATAQNKVSGSGVGVAAGTLKVNANRAYLITSQRDLAATFGNPFFYKTTAGTPINGYELNEYGLLAAFSALGVSNRAFVQRVDIDLTELTATLVRPTGEPVNGTYWLNTAVTQWGIFEWNQTTGAFSNMVPSVITATSELSNGVPLQDYGAIGDYTVVATNTANPVYYKNGAVVAATGNSTTLSGLYNTWVLVGSDDWKLSYPAVQGANAVTTTLTAGNNIVINGTSVAVPAASNNTIQGLSGAINNANITGVYSAVIDNKLCLFADSSATADGSTADDGIIIISSVGSTSGLLTTLGLTADTTYYAPGIQQSPNYQNPRWRTTDATPRPTGSVWNKTTAQNLGTAMIVEKYSTALGAWITQAAPVYENDWNANAALDATGGGKNIPMGTTYTQYNVDPVVSTVNAYPYNSTYTLQVFERDPAGATIVTGTTSTPSFTNGDQFTVTTSLANSTSLSATVTVTVNGTNAAAFVTAVSSAGLPNVVATVTGTGAIVLTQSIGGVILLQEVGNGTAVSDAGFTANTTGCRNIVDNNQDAFLQLSGWVPLVYTASSTAPGQDPANGRYWYYSTTSQVDIMIQSGSGWVGYQNDTNDTRGFNLSNTNPTGPIISATAPTTQTDGTALVYGDLWIDTSNLEIYPVIKRWQQVDGVNQWVLIVNTDRQSSNGILFADARWSTTGTVNPITGDLPTITSLLTSNYLDVDAPDYTLYPAGMLLFNTRRSGFNVKSFRVNYFNASKFSYPTWSSSTTYKVGAQVLYNAVLYVAIQAGTNHNPATQTSYWDLLETNSWVTASGNRNDGSPNMGRFAQRSLIVAALKSGIDTNITVREEQAQFNLVACTAYPELIPNMIALSNERNNTAFVVGDTPMRLGPQGGDIVAWATNNGGAGAGTGLFAGDGLTTSSAYAAVFYPSCQTTDLGGSAVVTAPSHMMVRTIIRSDSVSYPWLAPAGTRRGVIDNAARIGYINAATGDFVTIGNNQGLRDVEYLNKINPITFIPGVGITNFGNKTIYGQTSALDRINVARLVAFMRGRLEEIGKQFLFEPNDQITRNEISNAINGLCIDLVAKRGIYDFLVVCDDSNNTPARIDANELWVDIAIEPVKAVEFIYIPLRLKNTGAIANSQSATQTSI